MSIATLGRISKGDLENTIGKRVKKGVTILCSDGHHSYKGFSKDNEMGFHPINALKGERVKGNYHM